MNRRPPPRNPDRVVAIVFAALLLAACDTFFGVRGRVTDCATLAPLAGVAIDVHVERGFRDRMESLPNEDTTNARGEFQFDINDPESTWATLTFHREGYQSKTLPQLKGHATQDPPLEVCLDAAPAP